MRRANDHAVKHVGQSEIGDVASLPPYETLVLKAVKAAAQQRLCHMRMYGMDRR
jgi:hypothetical protein